MHQAIIYLKGFYPLNGLNTNHLCIEINDLSEVDDILEEYGVGVENINTIDFKGNWK